MMLLGRGCHLGDLSAFRYGGTRRQGYILLRALILHVNEAHGSETEERKESEKGGHDNK